jgi:hypothetical protein
MVFGCDPGRKQSSNPAALHPGVMHGLSGLKRTEAGDNRNLETARWPSTRCTFCCSRVSRYFHGSARNGTACLHPGIPRRRPFRRVVNQHTASVIVDLRPLDLDPPVRGPARTVAQTSQSGSECLPVRCPGRGGSQNLSPDPGRLWHRRGLCRSCARGRGALPGDALRRLLQSRFPR